MLNLFKVKQSALNTLFPKDQIYDNVERKAGKFTEKHEDTKTTVSHFQSQDDLIPEEPEHNV